MRDTVAGLAIGAAGGIACWGLGVPAPWLAGSMVAGIIAIFSGIRVGMPDWLKALSFIFLGIQTGTSVTWDTVDRAAQWPLSIIFLGFTVVAVTWACTWYYVRRSGWDKSTALFASLPGALSLVLLLASTTTADMRRVTIAQCIRLFFLVAALPSVIAWLSPPEPVHTGVGVIGSVTDIAILVVVSSLAGFALERLRVPAGLMLGPMLASAALELTGVISGAAPNSILIPANIVLGVMIASRFAGFTFREFTARAAGRLFRLPDRPCHRHCRCLDHQCRGGAPAGVDAPCLLARRPRCHDHHGVFPQSRPGLCRCPPDGALPGPRADDADGDGLRAPPHGGSRECHFAGDTLQARRPLMDKLAVLLPYKGLVVFSALAIFLVLDRVGSGGPRHRWHQARRQRTCHWQGCNAVLSWAVVVPVSALAASHALDWRPEWWSGWAGLMLDLLILDCWIYWWHRANHELPILWRFHEVHHLDEFLDASSALRFHFGEVFLSSLVRAAVIFLLGVPLLNVVIFETLLAVVAIFTTPTSGCQSGWRGRCRS